MDGAFFWKASRDREPCCLLNYNSGGDEDDGALKKWMQRRSEDPGDELCHLETCVSRSDVILLS